MLVQHANLFNYFVLDVGEHITKIGDGAFSVFDSLSSITLPHGLQHRGNYAFRNCKKLQIITLPTNIQIDVSAFDGCEQFGQTNSDRIIALQSWCNELPLHEECFQKNPSIEKLKKIIEDHPESISKQDKFKSTALHILACNPAVIPEVIKTVISKSPSYTTAKSIS